MARFAVAATLSLTACGSPSGSQYEKTCLEIAKSAERYQSTVSPLKGEVTSHKMTKDEFANEIAGGSLFSVTYDQLAKLTIEAPSISIENIKDFPSGQQFEQASLMKLLVDSAAKSNALGLAEVRIEYDVDNGNGVPERKSASCTFPLSDTEKREPLIALDELKRLEDLKRQKYGVDEVPNRAAGCCTPKFVLVDRARYPVLGGVIMAADVEAAVRSSLQTLGGGR